MSRSGTAARAVAALGLGLVAGALYWLMGVPTPAPPWNSLTGLFGILVGEYAVTSVGKALRRRTGRDDPPSPPSRTDAPGPSGEG
ncbi:DUF1427 family protein [Streptomyces kronopolitis]|uniref:DUF1427 family protein n=1 Tax=Streptomyces kronopolitis TaxID=1612435 RepID=UPI0036BA3FD3